MSVNQGSLAASGMKTKRTKKMGINTSQILIPRLLFILSTIALVVFGLVMVYSASFVEAFTDPEIMDSSYFFIHQLELVGLGLVALVIAAAVSYRLWNTWIVWIPWVAITALLILTLAFGNEELGGTRWYDVLGVSFQPSEFAKVAMLLISAMLLVKLYDGAQIKWISLLAAFGIGLPTLLILLQPDLGTVLIALAGIIAVAWFGELPMKPLIMGIILVVFLGAAMVVLAGFRMSRIDAWLDPWAYAADEGYQIINSFYAFADGGIAGVGLGMSHQKYLYLPQPHNDLIFPIIGEEFGLIGTVSVVLLFLVFLYAAFRIARNAPDFFGRIIAGSSAAMIGFQAFLNMLCMANLLPLTGKPLPFFSAGGSSIIVTLILVGLILNVSFRSSLTDHAVKRRDLLLIIEGGRAASGLGGFKAPPKRSTPKKISAASNVAISGGAASGKTASNVAVSGGAASGKTASGRAVSGGAASGKTASSRAVSGGAASGKTASGKTASSRAVSDKKLQSRPEQRAYDDYEKPRYRRPGPVQTASAQRTPLRRPPRKPSPTLALGARSTTASAPSSRVNPALRLSPARNINRSASPGFLKSSQR